MKAQIEAAFAGGGLRRTPQRYAVLEYLARHPIHATADQIYAALNRLNPRASRATVYNSLHALASAGLVREIQFEGHAARFDANVERHHHFVCDSCGKVEDVAWFDLTRLERKGLGKRSVRDYEVILRGECEACSPAD